MVKLNREVGPWHITLDGEGRTDAWGVQRADVRPAWREGWTLNETQQALRDRGVEWRWSIGLGFSGYANSILEAKDEADAALVRDGISLLDTECAKGPRPGRILRLTAETWGLDLSDLSGPKRHRHVVEARHVAMYLLRAYTGLSLPEIGKMLHRDHTTVLHGARRVAKSAALRTAAEKVTALFEGS